ncbi:protein-L-isoaspartate(D-aspartate) O-methyltransferase [Paraburkholderia sp. HC6.4b]|uniref:protein-L-isoaspartate(D-aspartate) O-methyltransferase n=1 Tax=unclassified Paraburkholderia TaxID=2615204 RepID=UPI00160B04D1|nr:MULTISPECIES: protein-L-isoaspartate(D-aspartate) O-methyltransferase [unclassified Paraburkholderia]MBB5412054.1 protein-L-isoaspartate(D-aspartate) O-methyltransferase [Paraburkholderia sp. HC6.4b]MBB5454121.1 protein-L-isoaspartate(D-aspartate) O-methyltransferase [Paraburkholderia sp. Kb1A]
MTGERAKRFPLGLEDLVREPRRPEGRPGEMRAAALAASAALNARQQSAKPTQGGAAARAQARTSAAAQATPATRPQVIPQAKTQSASFGTSTAATGAMPPKPQAAPVAKTTANSLAGALAGQPVKQAPKSSVKPGKNSTHASGHSARATPSPLQSQLQQSAKPAPNAALAGAMSGAFGGATSGAMNNALALTSERVRERMVERVRANGVSDQRVLNAMAAVPRHMFVDPGLAAQAYEDAALPIGHHQTISKPSVVARMIELAAAGRALNTVLEIGTGCGYQAAVLSQVAREVYSIERIKPLSERAKTNLRPLRIPNIRLHYGDGRLGLPSAAPFDAIVIAAAGLDVPQALLEQLAIGGRLVAPVGSQEGQSQVLTLIERLGPAQWRESRLDRVFFVPLKSGVI